MPGDSKIIKEGLTLNFSKKKIETYTAEANLWSESPTHWEVEDTDDDGIVSMKFKSMALAGAWLKRNGFVYKGYD